MYAVMTWGDRMPATFPIETAQNSGNMVHARAPFSMFPNTVGMNWGWQQEGYSSFAEFVNDQCDGVIIPFANTLRTDPQHDDRGFSVVESLKQFKVPIIPFGLGAQAPTTHIEEVVLGPGMAKLVKWMSENIPAISVRGNFTYQIFAKYGSVDRVYTTGCPSFFSRPDAFRKLKESVDAGSSFSNAVFAGSLHHLKDPKSQLYKAIEQDLYLVEPVNAKLHQYAIDVQRFGSVAEVPYFLKAFLTNPEWNKARLADYITRRYRLFRDLESWVAFNQESTDGAIGTRFHVNMASLLSGLPAVWVVHDSRTVELCDRLSLPSVSVADSLGTEFRRLLEQAEFGPMFKNLASNFEYFNSFLDAAGLPQVASPSIVQK